MRFNKLPKFVSIITGKVLKNPGIKQDMRIGNKISDFGFGLHNRIKYGFVLSSQSLQKVEGIDAYYNMLGPSHSYIFQLRMLLVELLRKESAFDVFEVSKKHDDRIIKHLGNKVFSLWNI